jgi:cell division transport system ATP-binding protein
MHLEQAPLGDPGEGRAFRPLLRPGARFGRDAAARPILLFEDVYKSYRPGAPVLRGTNLVIERGEFVFITGPSGAGKSTLLRLLYRAETVDQGRILFMGRDVARLRRDSIPFLRRNLGVIFQDFKLVTNWTAYENVAVSLEVLGLPSRLVRTRVGEALERVGLNGRGADRVGLLSGGEQQRIAIARAIVSEPALLLADEPTGNLDPQLAQDVLGLLEEIHMLGTTVLFATHDRSLLEARQRRVIVLDDGKAVDVPQGVGNPDYHVEESPSPIPLRYESGVSLRSVPGWGEANDGTAGSSLPPPPRGRQGSRVGTNHL